MCGIAGILDHSAAGTVDARVLIRMRDTMAHRGPDGAGVYLSPDSKLGLAHRRLAILDISASGHQPMASADGRYWIVFNGEIYNFRELRAELEADGHQFRSTSDTEVLLGLYAREGAAMLPRLRGMFAMAIWDGVDRRLWLARDRIGIKPLYYATQGGRFIFASEIKAILEVPGFPRAVDHVSLYHYFSFLTTPAPRTMFEGVSKLRPGHTIAIDADGAVREERYWDSLEAAVAADASELPDRIRESLRESVRYRMVSDVPFGVFLSGGVDSSANVALMSELMTEPIRTFSIGFKGQDSYNEFVYARQIAERFKTDHHEISIGKDDLVRFLPSLVHHQDEPIADPVCVPVYFVAKLAKDHGVTVCQVGEGADELFCGYPQWASALSASRWSRAFSAVPAPVRGLAPAALRMLGYGETGRYEMVRRGAAGEMIFWGGAEAFSEPQKRRLLHPSFLRRVGDVSSYDIIRRFRRQFDERGGGAGDELSWMTYLDLQLRLPELLLMRVDKMTMATAVEARVPFLDHELVAQVLGLPMAAKIPQGRLKHLLKLAVKDLLPDDILKRPKQGFRVPVDEWLLSELGPAVQATIDAFARDHEYLDPDYGRKFATPLTGARRWYLLNLALWHRHWIEQQPLPQSIAALGQPGRLSA